MSGSIVAISPPPPPPPVPEIATSSFGGTLADADTAASLSDSARFMADNYASSIASSSLSASAANSAVERATEFIRVADTTSGVDLSDGLNGDEYLLVAQTISANPNLRSAIQNSDAAIGDARREYFGQYGVEGRNLLDAAGNVAISADEAAARFNEAAGFPAAAEEAAGAEPAAAEEAAEEEEAPASEEAEGGAETGGWSLSELWVALLGLLDEDGDGKISPEEFAKGMRKLDTNGDGKLSKDELVAGGMSEAEAGELMTAMDENGDGAISTEGTGSELDTFVTELNANNDTEITQAELGELIAPPAGNPDVDAELETA